MSNDQNQQYIEGTISELVSSPTPLMVNGFRVSQPDLSTLTRLGLGEQVGEVARKEGQRGPAAKVWRFPLNGQFSLSR